MLFKNTVEPATWRILVDLIQDEKLKDFFLVGGTALSLRYGHRKSLDIDLFTTSEFDPIELKQHLSANYPGFIFKSNNSRMLFGFINDVKVDFVSYSMLKLINPPEIVENVRFASTPDIAALKLNAISQRGSKKDFYDLFILLKHYNLDTLAGFYRDVFTKDNVFELYRSMNYFYDADSSADVIPLINESWDDIKENIDQHVKTFLRQFKN